MKIDFFHFAVVHFSRAFFVFLYLYTHCLKIKFFKIHNFNHIFTGYLLVKFVLKKYLV
jgi:hypothetical protein